MTKLRSTVDSARQRARSVLPSNLAMLVAVVLADLTVAEFVGRVTAPAFGRLAGQAFLAVVLGFVARALYSRSR